MRIVITHGYLLTGTGSNLYVNNLVREWCKKGHEVYLVCQDFDPIQIDFINRVYSFSDENKTLVLESEKDTLFPGKCYCFKPDINGLLPVYVYDHYDGFTVKEFPDCADEEVKSYINLNRNALKCIFDEFDPDLIQTNHTVMFPYIAAQAIIGNDIKHYATVHGSALNFTVKRERRFVPYAIEGLESAEKLLVDSKHAEVELIEFLEEEGRSDLIKRIKIIPAGVDVENFEMIQSNKTVKLDQFITSIAPLAQESNGRTTEINEAARSLSFGNGIDGDIKNIRDSYDYRNVDADVMDKIRFIQNSEGPVILFIGKYLWTKGIYLILSAMPSIIKAHPNAQFVFVGFGPFREIAESILGSYSEGKPEEILERLRSDPHFFTEEGEELPVFQSFLEAHSESLKKDLEGVNLWDHVHFTGIVAHKELVHLLPCVDVLIAPSVFPEAFGMVAIEAMACGVYPVLSYQSAFMEITDELQECVKDFGIQIKKVVLDQDAPLNISANVINYLKVRDSFEHAELFDFKHELRQIVVENYSWKGIAEAYLDEYQS